MRSTATKPEKPSSEWQLQTAKARFSELFRRARTDGPQRVSRLGKEAVVVISAEDFDRLRSSKSKKEESFHEFLRRSPLVGVKLDLRRDKDPGREIVL